jgi:3-isopropylmalate/(R)-2-methylmalate dehydratase small subunit
MEPFRQLTGPAAYLPRDNVDTDVIIRIERLTQGVRGQLGRYAFEALRYRPDGSEDQAFPLNQPSFHGAPILFTGRNFGCGSSREGAVWALMDLGLRCVIAPSFGDIFYNNCFQNGMLPIVLEPAQVTALAARAADGTPLTVDLDALLLRWPDATTIPFRVDPLRRESLLAGLDAIGLTLRDAATIAAWQDADRGLRPWVWRLLEPQDPRIDQTEGRRL